MKTAPPSTRGFTLVELLLVMAVASVLTSLCILSFRSLGGGTGLTGAGDQVSALLAFARQEAISKDTVTAVVLVTSPSSANPYRAFSVWELAAPADGTAAVSANWIQACRWQTLPRGVLVDTGNSVSSFLSTSTTASPSLPAITYLGARLNPSADCAVQYFLPSGRLIPPPSSAPYILQLVEGQYNGSSIVYQHTLAGNTSQPANYVEYIFSTATGEPKIVRP